MSSTALPAAPWVDKASVDLEWAELLDFIARRTAGPTAARRLRELSPAARPEEARRRCEATGDALELLAGDEPLPGAAVDELDTLVARLERGGTAGAAELASLRTMLGTAAALRRYAERHRKEHPALAEEIASDASLDGLLAELDHALDGDGHVADRASEELAQARRRVASIRGELSTRIDRLIARYSEVLRDAYYAERDGRYVLPVRADAHRRVPGIVLGSSASGGTLYVEPQEITELGNRLGVAEAAAEREEARVLARLSGSARVHAGALGQAYEACLGADQLSAIAGWGREVRGVIAAPEGDGGIQLAEMRHPLLIGNGEVVPNDIRLERGSGLVISGPNAGGKTVALKCLGLAVWMARAGLPLPAAPGSRVGWFDSVLTDVGDDQSLTRSLSTFSAHIEKLALFIERADPRTLVLLDEVAAGTDPEEGSALAVAVLEKLVERGAAVAVTTHYERLKELAAHHDRFDNASVGFDFGAMEPTFKLELGVPGASSALAVAARHGMPQAVLARAEQLVPEHTRRREQLIAELSAAQGAVEAARREAEAEARRQKQLGAEVQSELERERELERRRAERQARELTTEVQRARAELRQARARLKQAGLDRQEVRAAERSVNRAAQQIAIGGRLVEVADPPRHTPAPKQAPLAAAELIAGTRVYVPGINAVAEVLAAPDRGQVRVAAGALKLSVPVASLQRAEQRKPARPRAPKRSSGSTLRGEHVPVRTGDNTLDLRGQRVDEALDRVDAFVDRLLAQGEPAGFVLHGHGTGALKSAVRRHLEGSRYVARSRAADPEDGGDAFTVLWIAG